MLRRTTCLVSVSPLVSLSVATLSVLTLCVSPAKAQILFGGTETNSINKIAAGGGTGSVTEFVSGNPLRQTEGVVFDKSGNLFVADYVANSVFKITPGGVISTYATGFVNPQGIVFDGSGNLYVANFGNSTISKVLAGGGAGSVSTFATGFNAPTQIVERGGILYVANYGDSSILTIAAGGAGGGTPQVIANSLDGLTGVHGIAFDSLGNLYAANSYNGHSDILKFSAGVVSTYVSSLVYAANGLSYSADGLVFDANDNLYATARTQGIIFKVARGGGAGSVSTYTDLLGPNNNSNNVNGSSYLALQPSAAPEASSAALLALGSIFGIAVRRRKAAK